MESLAYAVAIVSACYVGGAVGGMLATWWLDIYQRRWVRKQVQGFTVVHTCSPAPPGKEV